MELFEGLTWRHVLWSAIVIIAAIVLWVLIKSLRDKMLSKFEGKSERMVKRQSAVNNASNTLKVLLIVIAILSVLEINGVNVTSILTGLGIVGAAIALAAQDAGKDIIQGIRILTDDFFSVGDFVKYNGDDYQVVDFTLRTTAFKSLANGNTVIVSNRNISEITKLSGIEYILVSVPYDTDPEKADEIFKQCADEMRNVKGMSKAEYLGLREFEESSVKYQFTFTCKPSDRFKMIRATMRIIKDRLAENKIPVAYNKIIVMK